MINITIENQVELIAFWLAFSRWLAVVMQFPLFDNVAIPQIVKILGTLAITYAFFPLVSAEIIKDIHYLGEDNFFFLTIFNVMVGLAIGFFVKMIMSIFLGSGALITQQIGFASLRYFDPSAQTQVGPFEILIQMTILIIILSSGALLPMFKGVVASFSSIHIYDIGGLAQSPQFFFKMFKEIFLASIMLASPLIFTNMLLMTVLGIISRTVPQMNVIMVSFVVNIGLGLLVFIACSTEYFQVGFKIYTKQLGHWYQFIQ